MDNDDYGNFELDLMKSWQLRQDGEVVHVAARQQRLIAVLAVRGDSLRNFLAGLLWPEYPEAKALESLRVTVHLITRQTPGLVNKKGPMLSLDKRVNVDLHRIRAALKEAGKAGNGKADSGTAAALLQVLRDVDFLPGWYEDWVLYEQSRLRHDQLRAFTLISHRFADMDDYEAAADAAVAALELEPLYESAVRILVTSELAQGNLATALLAYDRYQEQLQREMGVAPSEGLRHLMSGIRPQAPAGTTGNTGVREPLVAVLGGGVVASGAVGNRLGQQPLMHNA